MVKLLTPLLAKLAELIVAEAKRELLPDISKAIDAQVDRITNAIPGRFDDLIADGLVSKLLARIPFLGGR